MQHSAKTRLHDILQAATHIQSYVQDKSLQDYLQSRMLRAAVEREFEIIGEALNHALRQMPELEHRIPDVRKIIGFRNLLIHGYAVVEDEQVWHTLHKSLPTLIRDIQAIIHE